MKEGTYRAPKPPKLGGKNAKALFSLLPLLVGHIVKPRPGHWIDIEAYPRSDKARNSPKKLTTGIGASQILDAMINRSEKSKCAS